MPGPYRLDKLKSCPRGKVLLRAALLAYRRNFWYNTKAACFTTDGKALHTTAGGWPHFRKGGETMRFTLTFLCWPQRPSQSAIVVKKQEPPLGKVTALRVKT